MKASVIITSGSTAINAHVRANCLWKCVNSMHDQPGVEFELILVDNCHGPGEHRDAIERIYETYGSVMHLVRNRVNEFHGGGVRQGLYLADGEIIVQCADDIVVKPGWLERLCDPLLEHPEEKLVGCLGVGVNVKADRLGVLHANGRDYRLLSRAGAYCWAITREAYGELPPWYRRHFADTRMANKMSERGYRFVAPMERGFLQFTNTNYLRPWDYKDKRGAPTFKQFWLDKVWGEHDDAALKEPTRPSATYRLKNPEGWGVDDYPPPEETRVHE